MYKQVLFQQQKKSRWKMHAHTHARTQYVECLQETVAKHLISIPPSSVFHLQRERAEQNALEQG